MRGLRANVDSPAPNPNVEAGVVYLLDDDPSVRVGVSGLLQAQGISVEAFATTKELADALSEPPDRLVLLVDLRLREDDGLDFVVRMRELGIRPPTVVMTGYADLPAAISAIRADVVDFLEKPFPRDQLFRAIDRAFARLDQTSAPCPPSQAVVLRERYDDLSPREREVLQGMVEGATTKHMARAMGISPRTVEVHRSNVLHKMQAANVVELVHMAVALGIAEASISNY